MKATLETNGARFEEDVLKSSRPVLVDFHAEWCGPCKMLAPVLEELAHENSNHLKVVKVNVDENPDLAARYNIAALPTLLFFVNGAVRQQTRGLASKRVLLHTLNNLGVIPAAA